MKSELNIMHGERKGIRVIQPITYDTMTGEKPENMPSGLGFSNVLHHRNNRKDSYQATMPVNNMGVGR